MRLRLMFHTFDHTLLQYTALVRDAPKNNHLRAQRYRADIVFELINQLDPSNFMFSQTEHLQTEFLFENISFIKK